MYLTHILVAVCALVTYTSATPTDQVDLDEILIEYQSEYGILPDEWKEAIQKVTGKVTGTVKDLMEKAKTIPSKVKKYLKEALAECRESRKSCKKLLPSPANLVCDAKFPLCIPAKLTCDPATTASMAVCAKWFPPCDHGKGSEIDVLMCDVITTTVMAICTGPAKIAGGCILAPWKKMG